MKDQSKSAFVFDLIDEFEIFDASGKYNAFTDEAYLLFCDKYKSYSVERDRSLYQYLNSTNNLFRCHTPRSKWVLAISTQVVWYYDELVIGDPVLDLIKIQPVNLESQKYQLQIILTNLNNLKDSIREGYLLLCGNNLIPERTTQFEEQGKLLVENVQVIQAFEKWSAFLKKPSPINNTPEDNLIQLETRYDGHFSSVRPMGMYFPPHVLEQNKITNGINYDFMTPFTYSSKQEIIDYGKTDLLTPLKAEYTKDIAIILETVVNAQQLSLPVLFYRDVDQIVAREFTLNHSEQTHKQIDTSVYDFMLPYLSKIPFERLAEVRYKLPDAFKDFRAFMFDLVNKAMKSTNDPAEIKFRIDSEIDSKLRLLKVEMGNAKRKLLTHGVATPVVLLAGSLSLYPFNVDYSQLVSTLMGAGGIVRSIASWSDVLGDKKKASLNPAYFLWKASQD